MLRLGPGLFDFRALGTSTQIDVRYKANDGIPIVNQKLSQEELAEEDKEETGKGNATFNTGSANQQLIFPDNRPPPSFLFPTSRDPKVPPLFLLPRSLGFSIEYFFDTPLLGKSVLQPNQLQTIRRVLNQPYR